MRERSSHVAQQVKDLVLSLQWLRSLLWHGFNPWPGNFHMLQVQPKKKKKNEGKIKTFLHKQKLREFLTIRPDLQEMLKGDLHFEMKGL